jgi:hypothetical protein
MTLVAASLVPDGVYVGADTRVTWQSSSGATVNDNAIKLSKIGQSSVIGFSGDIETIARLYEELFSSRQIVARTHTDVVSLSRWLPRFFRTTYSRIQRLHRAGDVAFLVAGSIPGRPLRLKISDCHRALLRCQKLGLNNWTFLRIMADAGHVAAAILGDTNEEDDREFDLPGTCSGLLFTMTSPIFRPVFAGTLGWAAIGSGQRAEVALSRYQPLLAHGDPGMTPFWFLDALVNHVVESPTAGVGGAMLAAQVTHGHVRSIQMTGGTKDRPNPFQVRMDESGTFVRSVDGREVRLKWPSEILQNRAGADQTVDLGRSVARTTIGEILMSEGSVYEEGFEVIDPVDGSRRPIRSPFGGSRNKPDPA